MILNNKYIKHYLPLNISMMKITKQVQGFIKKEISSQITSKSKKKEKVRDKKEYAILKKEREIEAEEKAIDFQRTFNTTVLSAFTFVAGLMWRDVANSIIELFMPQLEGLIGNMISATLVTIVILIVAVNINAKLRKQENILEKKKEKLDKEKIKL